MAKKQNSVTHRRNEILNMMLEGKTTADIRLWFNDNHPRLTEHSMEKDITHCYGELKKYVHLNAEDIINEHVMFYDDIASQSKRDYQYDTAIKAKQAKEKLLKLHQPDTAIQVNNNSLNLDFSNKSTEDILKIIDASK